MEGKPTDFEFYSKLGFSKAKARTRTSGDRHLDDGGGFFGKDLVEVFRGVCAGGVGCTVPVNAVFRHYFACLVFGNMKSEPLNKKSWRSKAAGHLKGSPPH